MSKAYTELTSETVTTTDQDGYSVGELSYTEFIDADALLVEFDGTEYECPRISVNGYSLYGSCASDPFDFSEYPFAIASSAEHGNMIATSTEGSHTIKIEATEITVTTTNCFKGAVKSVVGTDSNRIIVTVVGNSYGNIDDASHSPQEVWNDVLNDKDVILKFYQSSSVDDYKLYRPVKVNFVYSTSEVTGRTIRFQSEISWDEQQSGLLLYPIDILLDSSSNNYYWIYNEYWNGRYPRGV